MKRTKNISIHLPTSEHPLSRQPNKKRCVVAVMHREIRRPRIGGENNGCLGPGAAPINPEQHLTNDPQNNPVGC